MSDLKLNDDGDIWFEDTNDLQLVTGQEAILQHLKQRLKTFYGEWFLDTRKGVAYFEQVLIKNFDPVIVDGIFKAAIINTPGILELTYFDLDFEAADRELTLTFRAQTSEGVINFSEVIP